MATGRRSIMTRASKMAHNSSDNNGVLLPAGRKRSYAEQAMSQDREVEQIMAATSSAASTSVSDFKTYSRKVVPPPPFPMHVNVGPAPYSHESEAVERNKEVDYTTRFSLDDAKAGNVTRPVRVYADGIYDMFHTGHARQLMQAKMAFPYVYLIVGVCSDELTYKMKGRTVMNDTERYEAVRHCRYVDEVVTGAPWTLDMAFLEKHKIDFVAHDELPYTTGSADDVYKFVKERGMFLPTERTEGISTTDVITRIIKDYDLYVRRNLSRGYSHKELNVSYMKAKRLTLKDNYEKFESKLKDKGKEMMGKWMEQVGKGNEMLHRWEEKSKEFIGNFVDMFGKDGKLGQWLQENTTRIGRAISPTLSPPFDSPPSPSTSDPDPSSPPHKKGRFSPLLMRGEEDVSDDEEEGFDLQS